MGHVGHVGKLAIEPVFMLSLTQWSQFCKTACKVIAIESLALQLRFPSGKEVGRLLFLVYSYANIQ